MHAPTTTLRVGIHGWRKQWETNISGRFEKLDTITKENLLWPAPCDKNTIQEAEKILELVLGSRLQ